jgi:tRNA uridine 5-carboxymethylaminomethyl modification enzyme
VQYDFIRSIKGFEQAHITRPGYAIEYDYFDPRGLKASLESKYLAGLFFAGQINGTTGYEEAAAQGLLAGVNAALQAQKRSPWWPERDQAYLGVLVDDLISCGAPEPYRMFTSRAEYRLLLRQDNADWRLTAIGHQLGLVDEQRWQQFCAKKEGVIQEQQRLQTTWIRPQQPVAQGLQAYCKQPINREYNLTELLRRPEMNYQRIKEITGQGVDDPAVAEQVEIQVKYAGYIDRQQQDIERLKHYQQTPLPDNFDYHQVVGLSNEVKQALSQAKPDSLARAARIPGVTPAAISILLVYLKRHYTQLKANQSLKVA